MSIASRYYKSVLLQPVCTPARRREVAGNRDAMGLSDKKFEA